MRTINWITSWTGFEDLREQVRQVASEVRDSDLLVRQQYASSLATGLVCQSMKAPSRLVDPLIERAANAQNALFALHHKCVWEHRLDYDLVYNVWVVILDSNARPIPVTGR